MKISLGKLKTTTLAGLAERLVEASKNGEYTINVSNHPLLQVIENEYNDYKNTIVKQTFSRKGLDVAAADRERDKVFAGIKIYLRGYCGLALLPHHDKAIDLYEVFKRNDLSLDKKSYADESVLLEKLIAELGEEENKNKLKALNLEEAYNALVAKQTAFNEVFYEQVEANAELRLTKSATAIRKDLERSIRNYVDFVTAMKSQSEWTSLYAELNEIIKSIRNS